MGEKSGPEQTVASFGVLPPWRAVYDQSQHDEFQRQHREHVARFTEHEERISDEDACALVGLYFDLDPSWENPGIAYNYALHWQRLSLVDSEENPREEAVEACAEKSRHSAFRWDVLDWVFAIHGAERPLGPALDSWAIQVIRGRCPRPKGRRGPEPKMAERNYVIAWAVYILTECGMNVMRNVLTERAATCDIVAGVLADRNHSVSKYSSVLAIWQSKR